MYGPPLPPVGGYDIACIPELWSTVRLPPLTFVAWAWNVTFEGKSARFEAIVPSG